MPDAPAPALLFLDVDGPLIPFGGPSHAYPTHPTWPGASGGEATAHPLLHRFDPRHGPRLSALPCTLVWATTWMADANTHLAPLLGLPPLEVMHWPEPSAPDAPTEAYAPTEQDERDERFGLHWKTRGLLSRAAGGPFIWVDDEITDADRIWVSAHHPGPALLHRVDPRRGLTDADYAALTAWLAGPSRQPSPWDPDR
ncbi:hypothetical protein ACFWAR_14950 [Streptomyces sp. NPDC059917]|uniref:hypothetical protein n=1 Tax=Streptomyces sp. NPDC059917 TaxID=3347002 RepID=UPI003647BBBE